ncbi:MAG: hypothetical protein JKY37_20685 [Nannocystaceae bacterium]|nr:hypothetical protein [Nannocystaceae bacterium]
MSLAPLTAEHAHHLQSLWVIIATARGALPLSALGRRTWCAFSEHALGLGGVDAPEDGSREDQPSQQGRAAESIEPYLAHLVLAALVDVPLDARRVATLDDVLTQCGLRHPAIADLAAFARGRRLGPRLRMTNRILAQRFQTTIMLSIWGTLMLRVRQQATVHRYEALRGLPEGTFGAEIVRFYSDNRVPFPDARAGFPASLASVHDALHVLSGYDTTHAGELLVSAFESGASSTRWVDYWAGGMLHCQLGIGLEPGAAAATGCFAPEEFYSAFARGAAAPTEIIDPRWDFWPLTKLPLPQARATLGIGGRGHVVSHADLWCGDSGTPYDRSTPAAPT